MKVVSTLAIRGRTMFASPVFLAGLCFLIFSPIEILMSFLVHNSAIAGNAFHDAFDGIYFIGFGIIDARLAQSPNHQIFCTRRGKFGIVTAFLAIVFVAAGLVFERSNDVSAEQMIAGLIVGPVSFGLNFFWSRRLDAAEGHEHSGFSVHLLGDMAGSAIATISGIGAFVTATAIWNFWGGLAILIITFAIAIPKGISIWRSIRHTEEDHPGHTALHVHHH